MRREEAETLALQALGFLAGEPDALIRMLTLSGLDLADLRARAGDPELLAAVLDFLMAEEKLLTGFAAAQDIGVAHIHAARRALPGGAGSADQG